MSWPARDSDAEFRVFVRVHHPDAGGDPEVFRAGLAAHGRGPHPTSASPRITVVRNQFLSARLRRLRLTLRRRPARTTPLR